MIEVSRLSISLGDQNILDNISFVLPDTHNLAILGRSGSGKTVLIKTLLGIYSPDSGNVIIDGINVHSALSVERKALKKRFAMVFQNAALLDSFTVMQNVALPLYERSETDCEAIRERVVRCLQTVGLEQTLELYPLSLAEACANASALPVLWYMNQIILYLMNRFPALIQLLPERLFIIYPKSPTQPRLRLSLLPTKFAIWSRFVISCCFLIVENYYFMEAWKN